MRKGKIGWGISILAGLFCMFFLLGAGEKTDPVLYGRADGYTAAILEAYPDYHLEEPSMSHGLFSGTGSWAAAECLDVQAVPGIQKGLGGSFQPQGLLTVVFAVDMDQTDLLPRSWEDLRSLELPVQLPEDPLQLRLILAAAGYGLEGENYGGEAALSLFRQLARRDFLRMGNRGAAVSICLDWGAAERIREGENLRLLVPEDGTLSYALGLYTRGDPLLVSEEMLLQSGFRLLDGRTAWRGYPETESYASAAGVKDTSHFLDVTGDLPGEFQREVFGNRRFNVADSREAVVSIAAVSLFVLFWTASALHRSSSEEMRRWVWMIYGQMLAWLILCLLRCQLWEPSDFARFCRYGYYLFLMGLPLTILYVGEAVDQLPGQKRLPGWFWGLLFVYGALAALVFTNDFHGLVLGNRPGTYGLGYYLIFGFCTLCFLLSLVLLIRKSRKSPKRWSCAVPSAVAAVMIAYNVAYALGIPWVLDSSLPPVFCFFSIAYLEAILRAGLIPTNTRYQELFSSSCLHMQLLNPRGETVLASEGAGELSETQRKRVLSQPETPFYQDPDTLLHSQEIHGGIAIWQEDVQELNALQEKLRESIRQLTSTNALLHKEGQVKKQAILSEIKNQLFDQMGQEIQPETREISRVVRSLDCSSDRKKQISYIPVLLCHLKRRCNLFFLSREGETMSSNELAMYLDELSEFAVYGGIHALVRCGISGDIPVEKGILCYDFYFTLIAWAIQCSGAVLIGQAEYQEKELNFGVLSSESGDSLHFSDAFLEKVRSCGGEISRKTVDEDQGIYLTLRGEAELC